MIRESNNNYISLQEATEYCSYTQEYLSLRARQGKLKAVKIGRNWITKKKWVKEYIERMKEYNNNLKEKKLAEPPENLPVEEKPSVRITSQQTVPKIRFGFSFALVLALLITGIAFGKESFKSIFNDLDPYVKEINQAGNKLILDSVQSFKNVYRTSSEKLPLLVQEASQAGDIIIKSTAKLLSETISGIPHSFANVFGTIDNTFSTIAEKASQPSQELAAISSPDVLKSTLNTFKEYGQWISQTFKSGYLTINNFTKEKLDNIVKIVLNALKRFAQGIREIPQIVTGLFKKEIVIEKPEEEFAKKEEISKLQKELQALKEEGLPVKEIIKEIEVSKVTKIEPIKEITKEIKTLDEESLKRIQTALSQQETKVEKLRLAARLSYINFPAFLSPSGAVSVTTLGTITAGTWQGNSIADGYITDDLTLASTKPASISVTDSNPVLTVSQSGTGYGAIITGGNVGIGTTSPTQKLDVDGQIRIRGGSPGANKVLISDADGVATWTTLSGVSGVTGIGTANRLTYWTGASEIAALAAGSAGQILRSGGTNLASWSTATYPDTVSANQALYVTSNDVIGAGTLPVAAGGTGATTAADARTNLEATTLGSNLFTLTNPSAIRFLRINVDNTVNALTDSDFRTAIGAGTGDGTVTSAGLSMPTQFTVSGSPITSSGTLTAGWNTQTANAILAGPISGAAAVPTFRSLVEADIPTLDTSKITSGNLDIARMPAGGNWDITSDDLTIESTTLFVGRTTGTYSGRVGIGTTEPDDKLDIHDGNLKLHSDSATALQFGDASHNEFWSLSYAGGAYGNLSLDRWNSSWSYGVMYFQNSTGNVGIGTTDPTNILSLNGNSERTIWMERHTTAETAGQTLIVQAGGATIGATDKGGGKLYLKSGIATGTGSSSIYFRTASSGATGTADRIPNTKMAILGSGNVGIGTTGPQSKLDVEGGIAVGASYSGTSAAPTNGMIIQGNVGIGTTGPDAKLDVLDSGAQMRLTYINESVYTDLTLDTNGDLTINPAKNVYLKHSANTGTNLWVCEGTACPGAGTSMSTTGGNLVVEGGIYGGITCPPDMVYIPGDRPFCIDKYEAYNAGGSVVNDTCTDGTQAQVDANTTTAVAGSVSGQTPLVSINWCAAKKACQNAGKHLCTNQEWFQACNYKGGQWNITAEETAETMSCNTASECGVAACATGASLGCVTQEGAYDMIGNVREWVDKVVTADPTNGLASNYITGYDFSTALPTATGATANAYGNDSFWTYNGAGAARAAFRGGDWYDGANCGCFTLPLTGAPSRTDPYIGFRCCR